VEAARIKYCGRRPACPFLAFSEPPLEPSGTELELPISQKYNLYWVIATATRAFAISARDFAIATQRK
jgi:hypothetical protein